MKGKIIDFSVQNNQGLISGDDDNRYTFSGSEWKAQGVVPTVGSIVDFEVHEREARGVYQISAGAASSGLSKRVVAALFAFFLGGFGAHKFYLGLTKPAVIMLCLWIFGWILFGIPTLVVSVIAFIEFVLYLTKSDEEFERIYVVGKKGWF
ncbi:TM2 domain-containing protein [Castellaniella sp.]|uniref:TM2 domain-containing protein n=1 Tax=Castellaniella sp. TaxID=1955812 RepID=UPI002AFE3E44|nr:TM2 domain-containing protein [Castellaniella sp.]